MLHLLKWSLKLLGLLAVLCKGAGKLHRAKRWFKNLRHPHKEDEITMKKSVFVVLVSVLAAVAAALAAVAVYLRRREKNLNEYEAMLFSESFDDEAAPAEEETAPAVEEAAAAEAPEEAAPAEEKAAE